MGGWIEGLRWNKEKLEKITDAFICPSEFMAEKMADYGYNKAKLHVLHNFTVASDRETVGAEKRDGIAYIGRLSSEKGVELLLEGAKRRGWKLTVTGGGPLEEKLLREYGEYANITFTGHQDKETALRLLSEKKLSVVPSIWYENCPLSVIESLCCGTPVVGSDTGGIPELIGVDNGRLSRKGDAESLISTIEEALSTAFDHSEIARKARKEFGEKEYLRRLIEIYREA